MLSLPVRRMPVGAEVHGDGVHFRVWAPGRRRVTVVLEDGGRATELLPEEDGYFSGDCARARTGTLYRFRLDGGANPLPDPASRFQPKGPHGPSAVVDGSRFEWTDTGWRGVSLPGQVLYEMHVGTFTPEGSYAAAARELPWLRDLGVTVVELMPLAEFPGRFGWGYDGVDLFAPSHLYGEPDELRRFVDRAHAVGIGVILDVVYNHLGPAGNYLEQFAPAYFTDRYETEWGRAINFDGAGAAHVREFFAENAAYWIREFHFDGLRLDATQSIFDASDEHVLVTIGRRAREAAAGRDIILVAENEPQHVRLVRPVSQRGYGLDALWNDDLHHTLVVAASGRREAYYGDHAGAPQEIVSAAKWGYLLQGQHYRWQGKRRGTPALDLPPAAFVAFLENHDQVANSGTGRRLHQTTTEGRYRALSALILLWPGTPMLFQGQEFASSRPFFYFADHEPELAAMVREGRAAFLSQFPSLADLARRGLLADPADVATFEACRLDWSERDRNAAVVALYRDLLALRRGAAAFRAQAHRGVDGAVLGPAAFALRYFDGPPGVWQPGRSAGEVTAGDRLLLVNLGIELRLEAAPEPLLAPPEGSRWDVEWSSEDPAYRGGGTPPIETDRGWHVPGHAAIVLRPVRDS